MVEFFLAIFLMLASAWLLGEALQRAGQPALVGQLLAGVLIGPSLLNLVQPTADLATTENVALFFIMLLTGLAVEPARIIAAGRRGMLVSSISFVIPFIAGFEIAQAFGVGWVSSLSIGLAVSITAVPVNSIILMELGLLNTELGATVIAAGVIDDVVSFVALGIIQQFGGSDPAADYANVAFALVKVGAFLCAVLALEHIIRKNTRRSREWTEGLAGRMRTPGSYFAALLISAVGISLLAELAGLQLVVGAFFSGLLLNELATADKLEKAVEVIRGTTFGFFGPVAFTFIGTEFVLSSMEGMSLFIATLLVFAVASKFFGGYVGAALGRFKPSESVTIGFLMNSRGFVELVIAATAYQLGLINQTIFSMVIAVGIITTIISPIASRIAIRRMRVSTASPPSIEQPLTIAQGAGLTAWRDSADTETVRDPSTEETT